MPENVSLYWLGLGIILIALELAVPALFLVWFGLSAIALAGFVFFVPISLGTQVLMWSLFSIAMVALWIFIWKPRRKGVADLTPEGQVGMLTKTTGFGWPGLVRFQEPVQGSDEWLCRYEGAIAEGDRVRVVAVINEGVLLVAKI